MHANAATALEDYLKPGSKVLDVGCGSGYLTAVLARLVQPDGIVVGIEHLPGLSELAKQNLLKDPENKKLMDSGHIIVVTGDGRLGYPEEGILIFLPLTHRSSLRCHSCWRSCSGSPPIL